MVFGAHLLHLIDLSFRGGSNRLANQLFVPVLEVKVPANYCLETWHDVI